MNTRNLAVIVAAVLSSLILLPSAFSQVPGIINYQGRVITGGTNFDGTGQFEFAIVDSGGTTNYWSNDGTAVGQPAAAVSLTVTKGLYSVLLGDTSIANMTTAITPGVFANADVRLRVWFNDGVDGFQQLSPDQRLASAGYALTASGAFSLNGNDAYYTNGNVAIGITFPGTGIAGNFGPKILDVLGTIRAFRTNGPDEGLRIEGIGGSSLIGFGDGAVLGDTSVWSLGRKNTDNSFRLAYGTDSLDSNIVLAVTTGGYIGIGTNNPVSPLQVNGTVTATAFTGDGSGLSGINAVNFSGSLAGDVTGTQGATVVGTVGGVTAANVASGANAANSATDANTANTIVKRDASGNISAGIVNGNLNGNAATVNNGVYTTGSYSDPSWITALAGSKISGDIAGNAAGFSGLLAGDVTGPQGATTVGKINGSPLGVISSPATGQYLRWDGSEWVNQDAGAPVFDPTSDVLGKRLNIGTNNTLSGAYATIAGGSNNTASGTASVVCGGMSNRAVSLICTIVGGSNNLAAATGAFVGGGEQNTVGTGASQSTISGGLSNVVTAVRATIGGGRANSAVEAYTTIGGGQFNSASATNATVAGGRSNTASSDFATVAGGFLNIASGPFSFVGGGTNNTASGDYATVPGGSLNVAAGQYSFAAGQQAQALYQGSFVWADSVNAVFSSTAQDQFTARASGGVRFFTDEGATLGAELAPNATSWTTLSDRNAKDDIEPIDARAILQALVSMPVSRWSYKADPAHRRYIGPMAQDFHSAFGLGDDDKRINTLDTDGVTLAAIQGLNQKLEEQVSGKEAEIRELRQQNTRMQKRLAELEGKLEKVSEQVERIAPSASQVANVHDAGGM